MESEDIKETITSPEEIKPKNPKRVEQGKKLAQWSRAAKERKATTQASSSYSSTIVIAISLTAFAGAGYLLKDKIRDMISGGNRDQRLITFEEPQRAPSPQPQQQTTHRTFSLD